MELYKHRTVSGEPVGWAFIAAISDGPERPDDKFFGDCRKFQEGEGIPIELKIAGREFKFSTIVNRLMEDFDRQVNEAARKLVEEKAVELHNKMYELGQRLDDSIKELFPEDA